MKRLIATGFSLALVAGIFAVTGANSTPVTSLATVTPVPTCVKPSANPSHQATVNYMQCLQSRTEAMLENQHPTPPAVTETVTVTPTPSPTATTTTSSPTPTPTPTTPAGCVKPDTTNTGTTGTLTNYTGPLDVRTDGTVIEDKTITGDLWINADNVTLRNVKTDKDIMVVSSVGVVLDKLTTPGVMISESQNVTLSRSDMGFAWEQDTLHVTSDGVLRVKNIEIANNWIHDPRPSGDDHYDGLQVRGVDGLKVYCNNFDLGPAQFEYNAALYLEGGANGGISGAVIDNNWLFGGGYIFYYGADNDGATRVTNNHFGGDPYWGPDAVCYNSGPLPAVQTGNDLRGTPFTPCS